MPPYMILVAQKVYYAISGIEYNLTPNYLFEILRLCSMHHTPSTTKGMLRS